MKGKNGRIQIISQRIYNVLKKLTNSVAWNKGAFHHTCDNKL